MVRRLKLYTGKGIYAFKGTDSRWTWDNLTTAQIYVWAHSKEDTRRVIEEYCGSKPTVADLRDHFKPYEGVLQIGDSEPSRGLWITFDKRDTPERLC